MQVTVEKPEQGLEHKMTVSFPADAYKANVEKRLNEIRRTARMDGFRPGKVPLNVVRKRHGAQVHQEMMGEALQNAFYDAVEKESLQVAGFPRFDDLNDNDNGNITFTASFEVYPEIKLPEFSGVEVETIESEVTDADVEDMIERLREQRMAWKPSNGNKKASMGEQVIIDFTGKIDGEVFEGGSAENVPLELGSGRMIPGFEDGIVGMKKGEEKQIEVTFPENYHADSLKGKTATFDITVHSVSTKQLPEIDEEFVKSFGVEAGTEEALRAEIKDNMTKELARTVEAQNRNAVMESLKDVADVDVPKSLIQQEAQQLMQRTQQQLQQQGIDLQTMNINPSTFEEDAANRVKLGLLLGEIIKVNDLKATDEEVEAYISEQASSYEDPAEVVAWYAQNPGARSEIRAVLVENKVAEKILAEAKITKVAKGFKEVISPNQAA